MNNQELYYTLQSRARRNINHSSNVSAADDVEEDMIMDDEVAGVVVVVVVAVTVKDSVKGMTTSFQQKMKNQQWRR